MSSGKHPLTAPYLLQRVTLDPRITSYCPAEVDEKISTSELSDDDSPEASAMTTDPTLRYRL